MLRPYEMSKIIAIGPKNAQEKIIKELHRLKILHIIEHSKDETADIGQPLENANKLSEMVVKVRALMTSLNIKKGEIKPIKASLPEISQTVKKLNEEASKNMDELKKIDELLSKNNVIFNELKVLENINLPLDAFLPYSSLACFTGY